MPIDLNTNIRTKTLISFQFFFLLLLLISPTYPLTRHFHINAFWIVIADCSAWKCAAQHEHLTGAPCLIATAEWHIYTEESWIFVFVNKYKFLNRYSPLAQNTCVCFWGVTRLGGPFALIVSLAIKSQLKHGACDQLQFGDI